MNRFLLVFVFLLMSVQLQGCATRRSLSGVEGSAAKTFTVQAPSRTNKSQAEITRDEREEIEKRLKEVLDFCQPRLSGFEKIRRRCEEGLLAFDERADRRGRDRARPDLRERCR